MRWFALCLTLTTLAAQEPHRVKSLRITVLSTMLADEGVGEWGFAALVEADARRLLFDTGNRPRTVLENAREMQIDLAGIGEVVLSHNHSDHTGGLVTLRRELSRQNPKALARAHVGRGIFWSRPGAGGEANPMIQVRQDYRNTGGEILEHDRPAELYPGIWFTGPVARAYPERNWSGSGRVVTPAGPAEDNLPEDSSLVFDTDRGLVLLAGCGHAGMINILQYAREKVRPAPFAAVIGGFHLFQASDASLDWTAGKLREFGVASLLGTHCTGIESLYRLRERAGLGRTTAVVGAVGTSFTLADGIRTRRLR